MLTLENRSRHRVTRTKSRRGYPTWALITPLLPLPAGTGRPRKTDMRSVINALRVMVRSGQAKVRRLQEGQGPQAA